MKFKGLKLLPVAISLLVAEGAQAENPETPASLRSTVYSSTAVELFWERSTDDGSVIGYQIFRDGEVIDTRDALSFYDDSLAANTQYNYSVIAIDNEGNKSNIATTALTTRGTNGISAISGPVNLSASVYSTSAIELFWDRNFSEALSYEIFQNAESLIITDGVSLFINSLSVDTEYQYDVVAISKDGSRSQASRISVRTLVRQGAEAVDQVDENVSQINEDMDSSDTIDNLSVSVYSRTAAELFWDNSSDNAVTTEIIRDSVVVGSSQGNSFYDNTRVDGSSYLYTLISKDSSDNILALGSIADDGFAADRPTDNNSNDTTEDTTEDTTDDTANDTTDDTTDDTANDTTNDTTDDTANDAANDATNIDTAEDTANDTDSDATQTFTTALSCEEIAAAFKTKGSANADLPDPEVSASCVDDSVVITSNQIPDFPYIETSPGNPEAFALEYTIPAIPTAAESVSDIPALGALGMAINGIPIFGATEGTGGDVLSLNGGFTECGGHNGPTGYHYHTFDVTGSDFCLFTEAEATTEPQLFGYAFDGYPIYSGNFQYTSSWFLSDPSLFATDTFSAHTYSEGSGDLDQCNGRTDADGNYAYYTTDEFPYTLGCYRGVVDIDTGTGTGPGPGPGPGNGPAQ